MLSTPASCLSVFYVSFLSVFFPRLQGGQAMSFNNTLREKRHPLCRSHVTVSEDGHMSLCLKEVTCHCV